MSRRDPTLEILREGDLVGRSPVLYRAVVDRMLRVLRERLPGHAQSTTDDALLALLDAAAGALDTHGFYNDRALTESKVLSAQRLTSLRLLGELVAFSPAPETAAHIIVQLIASAPGVVPAGSALSGKSGTPPEKVFFETASSVSIAPAFNEMHLSPLATRHRGASRVVVRPHPDVEACSTPLAQFLPGNTLVVAGEGHTEFIGLTRATARALALSAPLRHSYAPVADNDAAVPRVTGTRIGTATRIRHLRHPAAISDDLVAFEVSDLPIRYLPALDDPTRPVTSLRVHVFDASVDPDDPTTWSDATAWEEVASFAESEAADRHYRMFVDDRLHTWIMLRRKLGSRILLTADDIGRVYVRFDVAVGRQLTPAAVDPIPLPENCDAPCTTWKAATDAAPAVETIALDAEAYIESLVCPIPPSTEPVHTPSRRAVLASVDGLVVGQQVVISGVEGGPYVRRLSSIEGRVIRWEPPDDGTPDADREVEQEAPSVGPEVEPDSPAAPEGEATPGSDTPIGLAAALDFLGELEDLSAAAEHALGLDFLMDSPMPEETRHLDENDPICACAKPDDVKFAPIDVAGRGESYALWADFYRQVTVPEYVKDSRADADDDGAEAMIEEEGILVAQSGRSFLLLDNASLIKPGDFFLLGQRRALPVGERPTEDEPAGDEPSEEGLADDRPIENPWEVAEIVQAQEVHGSVVRLRYPIRNDYKVYFRQSTVENDAAEADPADVDAAGARVDAAPLTRVYAVPLTASVFYGDHFVQKVRLTDEGNTITNQTRSGTYLSVLLDRALSGEDIRASFRWDTSTPGVSFDDIFLVIAGGCDAVSYTATTTIRVASRGLDGAMVTGLGVPGEAPFPIPDTVSATASDSDDTLRLGITDLETADTLRNQIVSPPDPQTAPGDLALHLDTALTRWVDGDAANEGEFTLWRPSGWHAHNVGQLSEEFLGDGGQWIFVDPNGDLTYTNASWRAETLYVENPDGDEPHTGHDEILASGVAPRRAHNELTRVMRWRVRGLAQNESFVKVVFLEGERVAANFLYKTPVSSEWACFDRPPNVLPPENWSKAFGAADEEMITPFPSPPSTDAGARLLVTNLQREPTARTIHVALEFSDLGSRVIKGPFVVARSNTELVVGLTSDELPAETSAFRALYELGEPVELEDAERFDNENETLLLSDAEVTDLNLQPLVHNDGDQGWIVFVNTDGDRFFFSVRYREHSDADVSFDVGAHAGGFPSGTGRWYPMLQGHVNVILRSRIARSAPHRAEDQPTLVIENQRLLSISINAVGAGHVDVDSTPWDLFRGVARNTQVRTWRTTRAPMELQDNALEREALFLGEWNFEVGILDSLRDTASILFSKDGTGFTRKIHGYDELDMIVLTNELDAFEDDDWAEAQVVQQWSSDDQWLSYGDAELELGPLGGDHVTLADGDIVDVTLDEGETLDDLVIGSPRDLVIGSPRSNRYTLPLEPGIEPKELRWKLATMTEPQIESVKVKLTDIAAQPSQWFVTPRPWDSSVRRRLEATEFLTYSDANPNRSARSADLTLDDNGQNALFARDRDGDGSLFAGSKLFVYRNEVRQLRRELYVDFVEPIESDVRISNVLTFETSRYLMGWRRTGPYADGDLRTQDSTVILWSASHAPDVARLPTHMARVQSWQYAPRPLRLYTQSIVLNSGNFIPIDAAEQLQRALASTPAETRAVNVVPSPLGNALRIYRLDPSQPDRVIQAQYATNLSAVVEAIDDGRIAVDTLLPDGKRFLFSYGKTPEGVFTLNLLLLLEQSARLAPDDPSLDVFVRVQYAAARVDSVAPENPDDPWRTIYRDEAAVLPWNPYRQMVLVDPGKLIPGAMLFDHVQDSEDGANWTEVKSVDGRLVTTRTSFRRPDPLRLDGHVVYGLARVPKPYTLDLDYYAGLAEAELVEAEAELVEAEPGEDHAAADLALADRLVLDRDSEVFRALIPGDRLRIWDARSRRAWRDHRRTGGDGSSPGTDGSWTAWPDFQHEAIIKSMDLDTGLVELVAPLPERFAIRYQGSGVLAPNETDLGAFVVQAHPRATFYGPRTQRLLGSGDRSAKFASYVLELPEDPGLASSPLDDAGRRVANHEVLGIDPRSGEWTRWTPFTTLDLAGRGDAAVTLSARATSGGREIVAGFGDGRTGALPPTGVDNLFVRSVDIGAPDTHVPGGRDVPVLEVRCACLPVQTDRTLAVEPALQVVAESSAATGFAPTGGGTWMPSLTAEVTRPCDDFTQTLVFREISLEEAAQGKRGIVVSAGPRPGTVLVTFFDDQPLFADGTTVVRLRELPVGSTWALDRDWYANAEARDLTRVAGTTLLPLLETEGLRDGSLLALRAASDTAPDVIEVIHVDHDTFAAEFEPPLDTLYDLANARILGNLVSAVQGRRDRFVVGDGDGATPHQRFAVHQSGPLLHVQVPGEADAEPDVQVWVDGRPWSRVRDFLDSAPNARVFVLERDARGDLFIRFGDGVRGAVAPLGTDNIEVQLRTGKGALGAVDIGAVDKLLDQHLAVRGVTNLTPGVGGRTAAEPAEAREALLNHDPLPARIVTVPDAVAVARRTGDVLHAERDPTAAPGSLALVVALRDRRDPTPMILEGLRASLQAKVPAGSGITVQMTGARQVAAHVVLHVRTDRSWSQSQVIIALEERLSAHDGGFFAAANWPIGTPLRVGDLYEAVYSVPGVRAAEVRWLSDQPAPATLPQRAQTLVDPGRDGVIRCDDDRAGDPRGRRGRLLIEPIGGDA